MVPELASSRKYHSIVIIVGNLYIHGWISILEILNENVQMKGQLHEKEKDLRVIRKDVSGLY